MKLNKRKVLDKTKIFINHLIGIIREPEKYHFMTTSSSYPKLFINNDSNRSDFHSPGN